MNKTHGEIQNVLAIAKPKLSPVCGSLIGLIASLRGSFVEVVWPNHGIASYEVGPKKTTEHYAYIGVQVSHINLGFHHGAPLVGPEHLLKVSGKKLRQMKLNDVPATPRLTLLLNH